MTPLSRNTSNALRTTLLVIWTGLILYATLSTSSDDPTRTRFLFRLLDMLGISRFGFAKTFHFASYGVWGVLLCGAVAGGYLNRLPHRQLLAALALLIAFASLQEALQHLNPTRGPSLGDVAINVAGGVCFQLWRLLPARKT